jgi:hypothetical protein
MSADFAVLHPKICTMGWYVCAAGSNCAGAQIMPFSLCILLIIHLWPAYDFQHLRREK